MTEKTEDRLFLIGAGVVAYFLLLKPFADSVLQSTGLQNTPTEREAIKEIERINTNITPFSPQYWRDIQRRFGRAQLITTAAADSYAKIIYDALNKFGGDDEQAVFDVFRKLRYKTQVSWLAERFQNRYGQSLISYLENGPNKGVIIPDVWRGLSLTELNTIFKIVNSLPDGK